MLGHGDRRRLGRRLSTGRARVARLTAGAGCDSVEPGRNAAADDVVASAGSSAPVGAGCETGPAGADAFGSLGDSDPLGDATSALAGSDEGAAFPVHSRNAWHDSQNVAPSGFS